MVMEVVLGDSPLMADLLDGLVLIDTPMEGSFYPVALGHASDRIEYPDMYGWAIAPSQREPFESLYHAHELAKVEKAFPGSFVHCEWVDPGAYVARLVPAPVHGDQPLPGSVGKCATWARFTSFGWRPNQFDLSCDLVSGRCRASIYGEGALPEVTFKVAPGKLRALVTIGPVGDCKAPHNPFEIYDGDYWGYILGTDDAVLLRGTRRYDGKKGEDPIRQLFHKIKRSGLVEMRNAWGFTI